MDPLLVERHRPRGAGDSPTYVLCVLRLFNSFAAVTKRILVTGASRGIGRATVDALQAGGVHVVATSRSAMDLPGAEVYPLDHSSAESRAAFAAALPDGYLHGAVLNAGALVNKPFRDLTEADFAQMGQANWSGPALLVQQLLPKLAPGAHIVLVSSMGGYQGAAKYPGLLAYATSKMAMAGLAESLQAELGSEGFSFNALCLGAVQTEMLAEAFPGYAAPVTPKTMGSTLAHFVLHGHETQAGQVIALAKSNP
ncbi:MAG: hypothetical protein RL738_82 [Bacteroidota bacterium]